MSRSLKIVCPCCASLLIIDPDSGAILREERKVVREHQSLDDALQHIQSQKQEAKARLSRAMEESRHREEILEKKFQEARKKAAEDPDPPPRPFDGD
jgi:hypothetical protein